MRRLRLGWMLRLVLRLLMRQWLLAVLGQRRRGHCGGHGLVGDCLR